MDEHKNLAHFYWIQKIIWIGPGPDRSSNLGPKTVKTGPKTDTGPVFARTDPTLGIMLFTIFLNKGLLNNFVEQKNFVMLNTN